MNSKVHFVAFFLILAGFLANGQGAVGIGVTNPNKNAVLELVSPGKNQGLLVPKLTTAERTALPSSSATEALVEKITIASSAACPAAV